MLRPGGSLGGRVVPYNWCAKAVPAFVAHNSAKQKKIVNITKDITMSLGLCKTVRFCTKYAHKTTPIIERIIIGMANSMSFSSGVVEVLGVDAVRGVCQNTVKGFILQTLHDFEAIAL